MPRIATLHLVIPGDPVPKQRPRVTRSGTTYTPERTVLAEQTIAQAALRAGARPCAGAVGIELEFYCATARRTDGDNLQKLVLDALNTIAYIDDYLIEQATWRLFRSQDTPRTVIRVYALIDDALTDANKAPRQGVARRRTATPPRRNVKASPRTIGSAPVSLRWSPGRSRA